MHLNILVQVQYTAKTKLFTEELSGSRINQIADAANQQHEPIEMLCNFISPCILYNYICDIHKNALI